MVTYEKEGHVVEIGIGRPEKRNAINAETARELRDGWCKFDDDDDAYVAILKGDEDAFSAGGDLEETGDEGWANSVESRPEEGWLGFTHKRVDKPTIAAIEGYCVAGGVEMACWCDLRVGAENATIALGARRFNVSALDGLTQRLPRIIGLGRALELSLTSRPIDAETAYDWGFLNRIAEDGSAVEVARELAEGIAELPQDGIRANNKSFYDGLGTPLEEGLKIELANSMVYNFLSGETQADATEETGRFKKGDYRELDDYRDEEN